jgi:hypothetical protein
LLPECTNDKFVAALNYMEKAYNSDNFEYYDRFAPKETPYSYMYYEMLKRLKPKYTVINLLGPFTIANSVFNKNAATLLSEQSYRKYIIQSLTVRALWHIAKIKEASPDTTPIIVFEEDMLYKFGTLKRTNEEITKETVIILFNKVFSKVQKAGALVCVQSFEKCNWQLVFEAGNVNIISFGAYTNPNNLNIISESVNKFMSKGGYINWGIIPVNNENAIRTINFDNAYKKLINAIEGLILAGVSADLLYQKSTVSVQGNMAKLPILFAEKALMLAKQISKKLPHSSANL